MDSISLCIQSGVLKTTSNRLADICSAVLPEQIDEFCQDTRLQKKQANTGGHRLTTLICLLSDSRRTHANRRAISLDVDRCRHHEQPRLNGNTDQAGIRFRYRFLLDKTEIKMDRRLRPPPVAPRLCWTLQRVDIWWMCYIPRFKRKEGPDERSFFLLTSETRRRPGTLYRRFRLCQFLVWWRDKLESVGLTPLKNASVPAAQPADVDIQISSYLATVFAA